MFMQIFHGLGRASVAEDERALVDVHMAFHCESRYSQGWDPSGVLTRCGKMTTSVLAYCIADVF